MSEKKSRYFQRGVSYSKSDIHQAILGMDKGLYPNGFCKILPDVVSKSDEHCILMHADTAGTKTSLAYMYWRETGDLTVWDGIVQDAIVMNLDDMACVGCTTDIVLSSTVGRNKHLIPQEVAARIIQSSLDFIDRMKNHGITLTHSGGETADVGDIVRTVDVGYTAFARMSRERVIENKIRPGNIIVGLASYGQATYEEQYNGGMGSNGLTSARHDILSSEYRAMYPESYDPNTDTNLVYSGSKKLTDTIEIEGQSITIGKLILSPTRTFLPVLHGWLPRHFSSVAGMIHCTGGGQAKVLKFTDTPVRILKDHMLDLPPLFAMIREESGASWQEMFQVFNMGHRMEVYLDDQNAAESLIEAAKSMHIDARIIGRVEETSDPASSVVIHWNEEVITLTT